MFENLTIQDVAGYSGKFKTMLAFSTIQVAAGDSRLFVLRMKLLSNVNVGLVHAASSVRSVICDANERSFSPLAEFNGVEASGARCSRAVHHLGSCIVVATYELTESPCDVFHFRQFDAHPLARRVRDIPGSLQAG